MISGMSMLFLVLLYDESYYNTEACSAIFTNLDVNVNVDHSTNVGEVIYTLMNGNDAQSIEMEASVSGTFGLNPSNDHEIIVTACLFWAGSELFRFKMSGDSSWCGSLNFVSSPAIPQFTNPTEIIKIGAISFMEFVDVFQVTFANDQCAEFECPSVTCTNDPSQNFAYTGTQMIGISKLSLQYGVTYTIEITCRDTKHSSGESTQSVTIVFYETAPAITTTTTSVSPITESSITIPTTSTITPSTTSTTPSTITTTPSTTTTTPSTTTTTSTTSPTTTTTTLSSTSTTPPTTTTTPATTSITRTTTTSSPSTGTNMPTTITNMPTITSTTPTTTTTILTTTLINPSTALTAFTNTVPTSTSTLAIHTTISATKNMQQSSSTDALSSGIEVFDAEITNVVAIVAGTAIGGVCLLGLIVFSLYWKFAGTKRISPSSGRTETR